MHARDLVLLSTLSYHRLCLSECVETSLINGRMRLPAFFSPQPQIPSLRVGDAMECSPLGFGTWAWGNKLLWGYDESADAALQEAFDTALGSGQRAVFFDTGDSYGTGALEGRAESLLGQFRRQNAQPSRCVIGTKLAVYPTRLTGSSFEAACRASLARMGRDQLEVVQAHWSAKNFQPWQEPALWDGLARCHEAGLARAVGTSNFGPKQFVKRAHTNGDEPRQRPCSTCPSARPHPRTDSRCSARTACDDRRLRKANAYWRDRGVPHTVNQVQLSLLSTLPVESGLLETCAEVRPAPPRQAHPLTHRTGSPTEPARCPLAMPCAARGDTDRLLAAWPWRPLGQVRRDTAAQRPAGAHLQGASAELQATAGHAEGGGGRAAGELLGGGHQLGHEQGRPRHRRYEVTGAGERQPGGDHLPLEWVGSR